MTKKYCTPEIIESKYTELGHKLGWRFITCPVAQAISPKVVIVSLNPAGREQHGPSWSQEEGSAYLIESWNGYPAGQSPLQIQVQKLVERLGVTFDEVLSGQFVPFRSPSWNELVKQDDSIAFGKKLWFEFSCDLQPETIVCIGHETSKHLKAVFGVDKLIEKSSGWGNQTIKIGKGRGGLKLISLPHLSRFSLFTSDQCQPFLDEVFFTKAPVDA